MDPKQATFGGSLYRAWADAGAVSFATHPLLARNYVFAPTGSTTLTVTAPKMANWGDPRGLIGRIWNAGDAALSVDDPNDVTIGTIAPAEVGLLIRGEIADTGSPFRLVVKVATGRAMLST